MARWVLHPSVAAGWWLGYALYADECLKFAQLVEVGIEDVVLNADFAPHVRDSILRVEQSFVTLGVNPQPFGLTVDEVQTELDILLGDGGVSMATVTRGVHELTAIWGLMARYRLAQRDADYVWLAIRRNLPLLVADGELLEQARAVAQTFPDFQVAHVQDFVSR